MTTVDQVKKCNEIIRLQAKYTQNHSNETPDVTNFISQPFCEPNRLFFYQSINQQHTLCSNTKQKHILPHFYETRKSAFYTNRALYIKSKLKNMFLYVQNITF